MKVTASGDPKDLPEAYLWLVGIGQVLEASEVTRPTTASVPLRSQPPLPPMQLGEHHESSGTVAVKPHVATPEEVAGRWCAWHGHRGHRTETCSHYKRWLRAWEREGKFFTPQQRTLWLRWMEENQSVPTENPPGFDPNKKLEPMPRAPAPIRSVHRERPAGNAGCYRCGHFGHTAAHCLAPAPTNRPYGPAGAQAAPVVVRTAPGQVTGPNVGTSTGFAHPGSGKKPPLPIGPNPPKAHAVRLTEDIPMMSTEPMSYDIPPCCQAPDAGVTTPPYVL